MPHVIVTGGPGAGKAVYRRYAITSEADLREGSIA